MAPEERSTALMTDDDPFEEILETEGVLASPAEAAPNPAPDDQTQPDLWGEGGGAAEEDSYEMPEALPGIPDVVLHSVLGRGGMGIVFKGVQPFLDRPVAVKCLNVRAANRSEEFLERFRFEARLMAQLEHEHIVRCHHAGIANDGSPYFLMELVEGPNLQQHVRMRGPLAERHAIEMAKRIAQALDYAFQRARIIHRDIKPSNILLKLHLDRAPDDDFPYTPKLVDLGLAHCRSRATASEVNPTDNGAIMGTPSVMAPEQFESPQDVDFRADIYALGCVLFQAIAGQTPFTTRSLTNVIEEKTTKPPPELKTVNPAIPDDINNLVCEMLAIDRLDRPQSYPELVQRFDIILARMRSDASGESRRPRSGFGFISGIWKRKARSA